MGIAKRSAIWNYSKDEIQEKVNKCNSLCDMLEIFGYKKTSGSMANVMKKVIDEYKIDTSHFRPMSRKCQKPKRSLEEVLIKNSSYTNIGRLKIRILNAMLLEYKCECCGNTGEWNGIPLTLQLDHKDGNHTNNSIDNLRFLCPNCHSQTNTYSGRNAKYGVRK